MPNFSLNPNFNLHIGLVTLFPEMFKSLTEYGVTGRAVRDGLLQLEFWNPRDFTRDVHRTVDDRPYGGGPGMVMTPEPLVKAIAAAKSSIIAGPTTANSGQDIGKAVKVIYLSPQGRALTQSGVKSLYDSQKLVLICGRYEGIDERVVQSVVDEEWSIGDYVLSGGELPSMVMLDALIRLIPGALGHQDSAQEDSFANGLLDYPHYTRPEKYRSAVVPPVLLSGDHEKIRLWRLKVALGRTWERRPDLLAKLELSEEESSLLAQYKTERDSLSPK